MRNVLVFALAIAAGSVGAAQTPSPQESGPQPPSERQSEPTRTIANPNQVVCRSVEEIGSRLSRRRVCRTRAEWADLQLQERQVVDRVQSFKPCQPYC